MTVILPTLAVAFAAFCIWLTVRIVNRRERSAKWTMAAAIMLPTLYVLSTGPAVWLCGGEQNLPGWLMTIYWPLTVMPEGPEFIEDAFTWYVVLWDH